MQRKSFVTSAAVAGSLALGLVFGSAAYDGVASAQTASPSASAAASVAPSASATASLGDTLQDLFVDKLAAALNIDRTALDAAIATASTNTAAEAVANGMLTPSQADAWSARVASGNWGFGGRDGHDGFGAHIPGVRQAMLDAAATALKLTSDEAQTQLRSGQTLAQLAQAQGTTEQAVTDAALTAAQAQLAQAVTDGTVTQAQADAAYAQLEAKGADLLSRGGRGGGRHKGNGFDGETLPSSPDASPSASTTPNA